MKLRWSLIIYLNYLMFSYVNSFQKVEWPAMQNFKLIKSPNFSNSTLDQNHKKKHLNNLIDPAFIYEITDSKFSSSTQTLQQIKDENKTKETTKIINQFFPRDLTTQDNQRQKTEIQNDSLNILITGVSSPSISFSKSPKINLIDFDIEINDFINFEQKTGFIELNAKVNYKWWQETDSEDFSKLIDSKDLYYPSLILNNKDSQYKIHNQIHVKNNFKVILHSKRDVEKKSKKISNLTEIQPVFSPLINRNESVKKKLQQFSYIEQNVTIIFKCTSVNSIYLDTTRFPFDSHSCELDFDLIPMILSSSSKDSNHLEPIYLFSINDLNFKKKRTLEESCLIENMYFNKLVSSPSNYSVLSKEWVLKQLEIIYINSTSPYTKDLNLKSTFVDQNISDYNIVYFENYFNKRSMNDNVQVSKLDIKSSSASLTLKFLIHRKREPQVYIFVLPLILFTLVTFIIFFMPNTENSSEKTIISFFNFIALVCYNIYIFKLVIYSYGFNQLPLILQYSNCLMVIQLGVLAYTCLVKSVHQNGFLILNNSFTQSIEESYRDIIDITSNNYDYSNCDLTTNETSGYQRLDKTETEVLESENIIRSSPYEKCMMLNRTNDSIKMSVPTMRIESENEALNGISTTVVNDENYCFTINRTDSCTRAVAEKTCNCNVDETDADCCNNAHCITQVMSRSNIENKISLNELVNGKRSQASFEKNELMVSMNNGFNRNWIFSCCGSRSPDIGKISPSPICEHVRPSDIHRQKVNEQARKIFCVSQASTRQVMPESDYTSHLARLQERQDYSPNKLNDLNQTTKNISFKVKSNFSDSFEYKRKSKNNVNHKLDKLSKFLGNSSFEITKLNINMEKMVKFEEIFVRDRILKEEWKRKARLCDGICCMLVFFLISVCSLFIFFILPNYKTASLID